MTILTISISLAFLALAIGGGLVQIGMVLARMQTKEDCSKNRNHCHIGNSKMFDTIFNKIDQIFKQMEEMKITLAKMGVRNES
jgi:hypothetical protein